MTKQRLWEIITSRNPHFTSGVVKIQPEGIRRLFDLAWDKGVESVAGDKGDFGDVFNDLIKKGKKR